MLETTAKLFNLEVLCLLILFCSVAQAQPRRGSNGPTGKLSHLVDPEGCLYCQIEATPLEIPGDIQFDCFPRDNGEVGILTEIPYKVDLPEDFIELHLTNLLTGLSTVCIRGGRAIRIPNSTVPDQIVIPTGAVIEVLPGADDPGEGGGGGGLGLGNRTVLVVRVSGTAESPVETVERMEGAVFGLGREAVTNSMRAQFQRCSFSKIDFAPPVGFAAFDNGVVNIQLNYRLRGRDVLTVMRDATRAVAELLGVDSLKSNFDHVMFCVGRGTTNGGLGQEWLAFAPVRGWRSVFNSNRCDKLSYLMHEMGHNLGLLHSAADIVGSSYGDTTGTMGFSEPTFNGPLRCFNANKNWRLGWYKEKALPIGALETWTGRLVAFVDYDLADPSNNEFVLLRVDEFLYVQYNRAKNFNAGTSLHQDEIVAVAGEGTLTSGSVLLAGLGASESFSWKGMTILVCSLKFNASSSMDYAEVVIHPTGSFATCTPEPSPMTLAPVTPAPTLRPSPAPTPFASPFPVSLAPNTTIAPTNQPTGTPVTIAPSISTQPSRTTQWVQVGADIDGEAPQDWSGFAIALSSDGTVLAIGALRNDGGGSNAGHVRVYVNTGEAWVQRGSDVDGATPDDFFGSSVALSADGTILAVGARRADSVNGVLTGHVQVYRWLGSARQRIGPPIVGAASEDEFGYSVSLSDDGTILAVGARFNSAGGDRAGQVRVFAWTGADWAQRGNDLNGSSAGDRFGDSVSLSSDGSVVACGADQSDNSGAPGYARIYQWNGSRWLQQGTTLFGFSSFDDFGESVSLSGDGSVLAVGADRGNYVAIFLNDGTDWVQIGQTIRGAAPFDWFGISVSLSVNGDTVVVGGRMNDSNGSDSGHALVYRLSPNNEEWVQVGQELVGEAADDEFGASVSISDDGTRIAVGGFLNDGSGDRAGHVRVFDLQ